MNKVFIKQNILSNKYIWFFAATMLFFVFAPATFVNAQFNQQENDPFGGRPGGQGEESGSQDSTFGMDRLGELLLLPDVDLITLVGNLINLALSFVAIILLLMLLYSGFLFLVSGSDEDRRNKAKQTALSAVIGVVIIFLAGTIVQFVFDALEGATGSGNQDVPF